jgi:hypothetical protein
MPSQLIRWTFYRDLDGYWQWKRQGDDKFLKSHTSFVCPDDCLYDAIRAGYQPSAHRATYSHGFKEDITGPILPPPEICLTEYEH